MVKWSFNKQVKQIYSSYIGCDVIEFSDEGVLDDVNGDLGGDHHEDIRQQHPEVI